MESILAFLVAARRCEVRELEQLARGCALVQAVSELVHRLQAERGCSNLHLASGGKRFEAERAACAAASIEADGAAAGLAGAGRRPRPAGRRGAGGRLPACSPGSRSRCTPSMACPRCARRSPPAAARRTRPRSDSRRRSPRCWRWSSRRPTSRPIQPSRACWWRCST
jgi:hypothetical protein